MNKLRIEPTSQESAGLDPVDTGVVQTAASLAQEGVAPDLTLQPKLRPNQDLIPALLDALARVAPAVHSQFMLLPFGPIPAYAMDDQASPWWDSEEAMTRADQLIEALYEADPHCYPTPEGVLPPRLETKQVILKVNTLYGGEGLPDDSACIFLTPSLEAEILMLAGLAKEHGLYSLSQWDHDAGFAIGGGEDCFVDAVLMVVTEHSVHWEGEWEGMPWETEQLSFSQFARVEPGSTTDLRKVEPAASASVLGEVAPDTDIDDGALGDRDYTLPADLPGVWVTVDNISVHVVRHSAPGSIPGVTVNLYPLGVEMDDPLGSATAYLDEAKALRDELDPDEIDSSRCSIPAPRTSDVGYEAWVRLQNQKLSGEDARLILTDAILAELKQDRVFDEHILVSIMKDPRPELVIAAMTWAASESSPISHCRETDLLCQALEAVFEDASRCFDRHPEWLPVAKVAAACYYKRAGVFPAEWTAPAEQTVLRDVRAALNIG